jgi:mRNA turnover protein 4
MPKSKRNKIVNLTKVKKRGREGKEALVEKIQDCFDNYDYSYVVSFMNMRSGPFKTMQNSMHGTTKFFLGKNKVMKKALGNNSEEEI